MESLQLIEKVCFFKKLLILNPYPQTPFPRERLCMLGWLCIVQSLGAYTPGIRAGAECGAAALTPLGATPKARTLWLLAKSFARCKTNIASNAKPPFLITIEVFLQPAAYSSVFDIYFIQRPCLFLVLPAFTQDIRKKHSCSE